MIERKQLVSFGLIMAVAALFFGWLYDVVLLYGVGAAFVITALLIPRALTLLYRPWMRLAEALGWLNTRILLILIFYLVVTPIGLVMRLFKGTPIKGGFWEAPPKHSFGDKHFEKQF
ncbi:MAG: SxtJ family membrane protein [Thermoanaerobaculia bacterium]